MAIYLRASPIRQPRLCPASGARLDDLPTSIKRPRRAWPPAARADEVGRPGVAATAHSQLRPPAPRLTRRAVLEIGLTPLILQQLLLAATNPARLRPKSTALRPTNLPSAPPPDALCRVALEMRRAETRPSLRPSPRSP